MVQLSGLDRQAMTRAIQEAKKNSASGNTPFGAALADGESILGVAANETESTKNPTRHAELVCIDTVFSNGPPKRADCLTLYSTCEPCVMCLGAAHYAGVRRVLFGVSVNEAIQHGSGDLPYVAAEAAAMLGFDLELVANVEHKQVLDLIVEHCDAHGGL